MRALAWQGTPYYEGNWETIEPMSTLVSLLVIFFFLFLIVALSPWRKGRGRPALHIGGTQGSASSRPDASKKGSSKELNEARISEAWRIVVAHNGFIGEGRPLGTEFRRESVLPFSKSEIREAIELLLTCEEDEVKRGKLETIDIILCDALPDDEYNAIRAWQSVCSQLANEYEETGEVSDDFLERLGPHMGSTESAIRDKIRERVWEEMTSRYPRHRFLRAEFKAKGAQFPLPPA